MSSHREAPETSVDPVADSTDLYAFVSPDSPDMVTLIANYVPLQLPNGGPNFYAFGNDVLYNINIDNTGGGTPNVSYQFRFHGAFTNPNSFLYNDGPITITNGTVDTSHWNRRQFYSVTRVDPSGTHLLASGLACPPCNIGPLSTPDYQGSASGPDAMTSAFIYSLPGGGKVFAGQRAEGFYVDLGAIFDLGGLRPIAADHATFGLPMLSNMPGVNATSPLNVNSIAIQIPKSHLTANGATPTDPTSRSSVIGVWTTASRQTAIIKNGYGGLMESGPYLGVSRLGNPLVNEVLIPLGSKDRWNSQPPRLDSQYAGHFSNPELAQLIPVLYTPDGGSTLFPNLAGLNQKVSAGKASRADIVAVFLTGLPTGVVAGFQNYTGTLQADMLRLNMAVTPATSPNNLGLIGGDTAGYPNGRRVFDDVTTIELKALAGATYPLIDKTYTPDKAVADVDPGLTSSTTDTTAKGSVQYLTSFPYLGTPHSGYYTPSATPAAVPPQPAP